MKKMIVCLICVFPFLLSANGSCLGKFELINKMIVVEATIEGLDGYFIVDTGSPDLVLNSQHFEGTATEDQMSGIGGMIHTERRMVRSFQWGCAEKKNFGVYVVNLNYLEQAIGKPFFGLIGYGILKKKELLIDYEKEVIEQHELKKSDLHRLENPVKEVSFQLDLHIPVLEIEMGEQSMKFILDTASEDNILDKAYESKKYLVKNSKILLGADQKESLARVVVVPEMSMTTIDFENQECLVTSLQNTSVEGILGFPALNELSKFSINYKKKKIYIWE